MERELIVERTSAGLEVVRSKGRIGGRRPKLTPEQWEQAGGCLPPVKLVIVLDCFLMLAFHSLQEIPCKSVALKVAILYQH